MKKWTVILLYPDYLSEEYGHDTYMTCVTAADPTGAVAKARSEVGSDDAPQRREDFSVIAVMRGDHEDVNPER